MSINRGLRRWHLFVLFRLEEERLKERRRSYSFSLEFVCSFTSFFSLILAPSVLRLSGSVSIAKVRACLIIALRNSKLLIKGRDGGIWKTHDCRAKQCGFFVQYYQPGRRNP